MKSCRWEKLVSLLLCLFFVGVGVAQAVEVQVSPVRSGEVRLTLPGGETVLSEAKKAVEITMPTGEKWQVDYYPIKNSLLVTGIKGKVNFLFPVVKVTVSSGEQTSLLMDEKGQLREVVLFPESLPSPLTITFPDGSLITLSPGARISLLYLADGTLRIVLVSGKANFTDKDGKTREMKVGEMIVLKGFGPFPDWRVSGVTETRPTSPAIP